jgi:hypothetical protein
VLSGEERLVVETEDGVRVVSVDEVGTKSVGWVWERRTLTAPGSTDGIWRGGEMMGWVTMGQVTVGLVTVGLVTVGLVTVGQVTVGLVTVGQVTVGNPMRRTTVNSDRNR